jgi:hypothetical protein
MVAVRVDDMVVGAVIPTFFSFLLFLIFYYDFVIFFFYRIFSVFIFNEHMTTCHPIHWSHGFPSILWMKIKQKYYLCFFVINNILSTI